jgi:aryl-alcohol dehydrogenase-like predicted oxidoreductase
MHQQLLLGRRTFDSHVAGWFGFGSGRSCDCVAYHEATLLPDVNEPRKPVIPKRRLGAKGPEITVLGLGTWAIGGPYEFGWGPVDDQESIAAIRRGIASGINWLDTAPVYGLGHSEEIVGRAIRPWRAGDEILVFTKCGRNYYSQSRISSNLRPETIRAECEESLQRLGVDRIDLLQFHWPDPDTGTAIEDSWGTVVELVDEGKIRWAGVSNFDVALLERCQAIRHVDSVQPPFNLIQRSARNDLMRWCREHGVGVIVYAPMASGLLTGKYDRKAIEDLAPDDWRRRSTNFTEPALSRNLRLVEALRPVAHRLGTTLAALAIAWTLSTPGVTGAIGGARRPDQVDGWIRASEIVLDPETLQEIETLIADVGAGEG